jgi:carnitine O-palmitoyltransferase 2
LSISILGSDGTPHTPRAIASAFASVRATEASRGPAGAWSSVGYYTSGPRTKWAEARARITANAGPWALRDLDTALMVVCLDSPGDAGAGSASELCAYLLNNGGRNRYFDKSVQLTSLEHPSAGTVIGVNFEHTWGDGMAVLQAFSPIVNDAIASAAAAPTAAEGVDT